MSREPEHDWTSHCADALRTYATSRSSVTRTRLEPQPAGYQAGQERAAVARRVASRR